MIISAIAATAKNGVIGKDNKIPWYLPADLKYFKRTTLHHHIIMGRKNFQAMGRPLPKRTNIVITRNPFFIASNCLMARSVEEALKIAQDNGEEEAFIIGGGQIYAESLPFWDRLYLTEIELEASGEVFFPEIDYQQWQLISSQAHQADEKNACDYTFKVFERRPARPAR